MKNGVLLATRRSLVDRLANWDDQRRWQKFFGTYWKLIYSAARKSGLTDTEAQVITRSPNKIEEFVKFTILSAYKEVDKGANAGRSTTEHSLFSG
jgi:hypothetical protein